jgi:hypothetical protein
MNLSVAEVHALRIHAGDGGIPQHLHAAFFRPGNQPFMKHWPPQSNSRPLRKIGSDPRALLRKAYSAEFLSLPAGNLHAQLSQGSERLRHHPFPARLLNRRRRTVRDDCPQSLLARGNSHRQPRRPAAYDEYVRIL